MSFNKLITALFTRRQLQPVWHALFKLSLRGMGILNAGDTATTGEQWFINQLARHQLDTVIDVGANTQVFGGDQLRAKAIHAFEPHPHIFNDYLSQTPSKNKYGTNIYLHNLAVSSCSKKMKLWDYADEAPLKETQPTSTLASLNRAVIEDLHGQPAQAYSVSSTSLDAFCRKHNIDSISLLKIDVEGSELEVLRGAKRLLEQNQIHHIQFEFNQMHVYQRVFFKDFIDLLPQYKLYRLSKHGLIPLKNYSPVTHELFAYQNVLAINQKSAKKLF